VTDFGGVNVKELLQGVKDSLLDPNSERTSPASISNVLATIDDVLALATGSGGGGLKMEASEAEDSVSGSHTTASAALAGTGISTMFTLTEPQTVLVVGQATAQSTAPGTPAATRLGFFHTAPGPVITPHEGTATEETVGGGGAPHNQAVFVSKALITLPAGTHTIELAIAAFGGGTAKILADATHPARITVYLGRPIFGVGALDKVESIANGGGQHEETTQVFSVVPGTTLNFTLQQQQTVLVQAYGTCQHDTAQGGGPNNKKINSQIGLRIDGTDYEGTSHVYDQDGLTIGGEDDRAGLSVHKAITLLAGAHTVDVVLRKAEAKAGNEASLLTTADHPVVVSAVFTKPETFPQALGFVKASTMVTSDHAIGGSSVVPGSDVTFTLTVVQDVLIKGQTAGIFGNAFAGQCECFLRHTFDPGGADVITDYKIGKQFGSDGGDFLAESTGAAGEFLVSLAVGTHKLEIFASGGFSSIAQPIQTIAIAKEPI